MTRPQLKRSINLPMLVLYGLGTTVGAGFYALLGKVAGEAEMLAPLALAASGALAMLSALSFAELSSRYPLSAGEAMYVRQAFHNISLSTVVGWLVIVTGIVSAATLSVATVGFVQEFFAISTPLAVVLVVVTLGSIAAWGIGQSVAVVGVITVIEIGGLLVVSILAGASLAELPARLPEFVPDGSSTVWFGVFGAAFLAFYAFIGFEDMVNMAEEVKDVCRTLPKAIVIAIISTTLIYMMVATIAVLAVPPAELAQARAPIARIVADYGWLSSTGLVLVSLLAGINGALVQIIMAARVAYGLAQQKQAPIWLGQVNKKTRTPLNATLLMTAIVLLLALFFPLTTLAKIASCIVLVIFSLVNAALFHIKGKHPDLDGVGPRYPRWLSLVGALVCFSVLVFQAAIAIQLF